MTDVKAREVTALAPLVLLTIVLGVFPTPALDVINPAVEWTQQTLGVVDPPPQIDTPGGGQ